MPSTIPEMLFRGKVRDTYPSDEPEFLVVVASDRISVYDVVLNQGIPGKGKVLTYMTEYWLTKTPVADVTPNHLVSGPRFIRNLMPKWAPRGRSLLVQRLDMLPIEAIVRGYLTGSGWKEYQATGKVSGIVLPAGMQEMDKFPVPVFTPSTKAAIGEHDENIDFDGMVDILGGRAALAVEVREKSLELYRVAAEFAFKKGIILVDTKFEFGLHPETGKLTLGDEVLTPDSSRYVPVEKYEVGKPPVSMDKQPVRDWATSTGWNKKPPPPDMPREVVNSTVDRYGDVCRRLTGVNPIAYDGRR